MKKILAHCLCLLLIISVAAQTPPARTQQQPSPPAAQDEEVLRITTELVQAASASSLLPFAFLRRRLLMPHRLRWGWMSQLEGRLDACPRASQRC